MDKKEIIRRLKRMSEHAVYIPGRPPFIMSIDDGVALDEAVSLMEDQQELKTGYWIDSAGNDKCSNCGTEYSDLYPDYGNTHFCPNCGAKMEKKK